MHIAVSSTVQLTNQPTNQPTSQPTTTKNKQANGNYKEQTNKWKIKQNKNDDTGLASIYNSRKPNKRQLQRTNKKRRHGLSLHLQLQTGKQTTTTTNKQKTTTLSQPPFTTLPTQAVYQKTSRDELDKEGQSVTEIIAVSFELSAKHSNKCNFTQTERLSNLKQEGVRHASYSHQIKSASR